MAYVENSIVKRYEHNPILTAEAFPKSYRIKTVFNSGIAKYRGRYIMVCRVEDASIHNYFWLADSEDGYSFTPRPAPVAMPDDNPLFAEYTRHMYYDPRVTQMGEDYYLVHAAHSYHGCRLSLMHTRDFETFEWKGFISEPDNRNGVLFPEKINGYYVRLDRPNHIGDMWVSYSPDLIHWGQSQCVLKHGDVRWAWEKLGGGAIPIKTEKGWLNIFHGVRYQCKAHYVYQLGVCLHELDNPARLVGYSKYAILQPEEEYELTGQTPSVVFTSGAICEDNGEIKLYYGGADTVQCVGTTTVESLLSLCIASS